MKKSLVKLGTCFLIVLFFSCDEKKSIPSRSAINAINLKRGELISCGPTGSQFGMVEFEFSGSQNVKKDFNLAIALLHSFEYDEAEKVFSKIINEDPGCAMAYWGIAMCNYHPLWAPPSVAELKKGASAIALAQSIQPKTIREAGYIDAIASFYKNWDKLDHNTRTAGFESAMEKLYKTFPNDNEAAIFYALALDAAADPADKTFKNQKKAGAILNSMYLKAPDHPGVAHYLIHTYDYPELADSALSVARKYAGIAPSSAHALHMPSHTYTMLGLWDESIQSNLASVAAAKCYAESAGIKGHWDEELHGMDYLVYAYLQKGQNELAKKQLDYLQSFDQVYPLNFKVAYAFAAIPCRILFENKNWKEAASLQVYPAQFPWKNFPWQKAIFHFTRLMGAIHTEKINAAQSELQQLKLLYDALLAQGDVYKSNQVQIQIKSAEAWFAFRDGRRSEALELMNTAADMQDKTEKHPVTPGEVVPARELLGDMLLQMDKPREALEAYAADLEKHPNRFNGLYGAALAAETSGNVEMANMYYRQLLNIANRAQQERTELMLAKRFLKSHKHL